MTDPKELRECPRCGSADNVYLLRPEKHRMAFVKCTSLDNNVCCVGCTHCQVQGPPRERYDEAIAAWNKLVVDER